MFGFLRFCFAVVWRRIWVLVVLNWLFFGLVVVGSLLMPVQFAEGFAFPFGEVFPVEEGNALLLFGFIFFINLVLSSFLLVTLTGFVFFGLSVFFLCLRGVLWGVLLTELSTPMFLGSMLTLVLEGEGYVLAALAGVTVGLSWLKPSWVYKGEEEVSRSEAVRKALKDCARLYVVVALFLFSAAVVEVVAIIFIRQSFSSPHFV